MMLRAAECRRQKYSGTKVAPALILLDCPIASD